MDYNWSNTKEIDERFKDCIRCGDNNIVRTDGKCKNCYEVENRLYKYLNNPNKVGVEFVQRMLDRHFKYYNSKDVK